MATPAKSQNISDAEDQQVTRSPDGRSVIFTVKTVDGSIRISVPRGSLDLPATGSA